MNRFLLALGIVFVSAGLLWPWLKRMHLFQLPGDILIDRPGFKFIFPITTMLIVSAGLSGRWAFNVRVDEHARFVTPDGPSRRSASID